MHKRLDTIAEVRIWLHETMRQVHKDEANSRLDGQEAAEEGEEEGIDRRTPIRRITTLLDSAHRVLFGMDAQLLIREIIYMKRSADGNDVSKETLAEVGKEHVVICADKVKEMCTQLAGMVEQYLDVKYGRAKEAKRLADTVFSACEQNDRDTRGE